MVDVGWSINTDWPKSLEELYRIPIFFIRGKKSEYIFELSEIVIVKE